ncbi:fibrinogen-like protein 1 [Palaemon carinicauda]|uniref:fibrinogen-like protein 1 n=1 Tax=Palaemon carinicauda TaxID=392227 RepID=UPI0035B66999
MNDNTGESCTGYKSCNDLYEAGSIYNGIFSICPISTCNQALTYCDMTSDGGKWTVFLSRDKDHTDQELFNRTWDEYKEGFGSCDHEYWLGNEILYNLTNERPQMLRIEGTDGSGNTKWAHYNTFKVASENDNYQVTISGYDPTSTMGDLLTPTQTLANLNTMEFSTLDEDNDNYAGGSCSKRHNNGGGFWYHSCSLIGPTNNAGVQCYYWNTGVAGPVTLKKLKMSIRPV